MRDFFLALFFPSFCFSCKREGTYLCHDCTSLLEISEYNYCLCSKNPLRIAPASDATMTGTCNRCRNKNLSGLYFAVPYKEHDASGGLIKKLIYQFKYQPYLKKLSKTLAEIIAEHLVMAKNNTAHLWNNSVFIPVPLEKSKLKHRGYNQSEELAKELRTILNITVVSDVLMKIKATPSQTKLSKKEREENLKDAFVIKNPAEIAGKKVFLIDDVYTTGSTMEACATVLKEAGASSVWGITIAREE